MIDVLINNATIVTMNENRDILKKASIAIGKDRIIEIGFNEDMVVKYKDAKKIIDATDKVVFPGLINTHTHSFQSLAKGLGDDRVLYNWLVDAMFPTNSKMDPESSYYAAALSFIDSLRSGTTTVVDYMHAHPVPGNSDAVIKCFKDIGMRGIFARGYIDEGGQYGTPKEIMNDFDTIFGDCRRLLEKYHNSGNGRIKIWIAPSAVWLSSKESLLESKKLADEYNTNITIHTYETKFDGEATIAIHGMSEIDTLENYGLLGPNLLMVHCVHLDDETIDIMKRYDVKVSHNPVSNMYLSSGVAPIPKLIEKGVTCSLATDGAASNSNNDMLEVLKCSALMQKVYHLDPTIISAEKVLELATIEGARAIGLEDEIGSLEIGKKADLFIFNPANSVKSIPMHNPVSTLIYSSSQVNIETVLVDGDVILENGVVTNVDEEHIIKKGQDIADEVSYISGTYIQRDRTWKKDKNI